MAKLALFEYAVLLHPEEDEDGNTTEDTVLIVEPVTKLAKDEKTLALHAARAIPDEHEEALDRIEIRVRPF